MDRSLKSVRRILFVVVLGALALFLEPFRLFAVYYALTVFHVVFKLMRQVLPHVTRA
jgi:hypothetical protein